jgi:uncharacterized protein
MRSIIRAFVCTTAQPSIDAAYRPTGAVFYSVPGTLDHWLTERYCLFSARNPGQVVYGDIHHGPWPLQPAEAEVRVNTMLQPIEIKLPNGKPVSHFARYREVVAWPIVTLEEDDETVSE